MTTPERSLILLESAKGQSSLSEQSMEALRKASSRKLTLGQPANNYNRENILLVAALLDDSTSLNVYVHKEPNTEKPVSKIVPHSDPRSNSEAVRIGHNAVIDSLTDSNNPSSVWFHTRYLNGFELNPWNRLEAAKKLDRDNFKPEGGTPLYDEAAVMLRSVITKTQEFKNNWVGVRTATLIVTDGEDSESKVQTPSSVKSIVTDMYSTGIHIVAAMGIYDGRTDFRKVFIEMGVHENLILTPGSTPDEIRKAFGLFGRMASQATNFQQFDNLLNQGFLALPPGN